MHSLKSTASVHGVHVKTLLFSKLGYLPVVRYQEEMTRVSDPSRYYHERQYPSSTPGTLLATSLFAAGFTFPELKSTTSKPLHTITAIDTSRMYQPIQ